MTGDPLTQRELETLQGIATGASYDQLASAMHVSLSTVKTNLRHVYEKLHARNGAHAVHIGWQRGILGPSTPVGSA